MWLETPLVDHVSGLFCFYLLFVSTLEDATMKSVSRSVFFSQYPWQQSNTWLKNTHFIQPGSHTSLSDGSQTLTDSPHVWPSVAEWLQVGQEWDSPVGWKTESICVLVNVIWHLLSKWVWKGMPRLESQGVENVKQRRAWKSTAERKGPGESPVLLFAF